MTEQQINDTAIHALAVIGRQTLNEEPFTGPLALTGPQARRRMLDVAFMVQEERNRLKRAPYQAECDRLNAAMFSGDMDPVEWQRRVTQAAREECARTGAKERYS